MLDFFLKRIDQGRDVSIFLNTIWGFKMWFKSLPCCKGTLATTLYWFESLRYFLAWMQQVFRSSGWSELWETSVQEKSLGIRHCLSHCGFGNLNYNWNLYLILGTQILQDEAKYISLKVSQLLWQQLCESLGFRLSIFWGVSVKKVSGCQLFNLRSVCCAVLLIGHLLEI